MSWREDTGEVTFPKTEKEPLEADAVILDEMSMVDLQLFTALLRALRPGCRLVMVGDPDQLPSVGAGNVFSDLIRSGRIPVVALTEIFRQAQSSAIIRAAHAVNGGSLPPLKNLPQRLLLSLPPGSPGGWAGGGAGQDPPAPKYGHSRQPDPGPDAHPQGPRRDAGVEPGAAGGAESAYGGQAPAALGRAAVPGGGPGHADPERLRRGVGDDDVTWAAPCSTATWAWSRKSTPAAS